MTEEEEIRAVALKYAIEAAKNKDGLVRPHYVIYNAQFFEEYIKSGLNKAPR